MQELVNAARTIQEYCESVECKDCVFYDPECSEGCGIRYPFDWRIPVSEQVESPDGRRLREREEFFKD